MNLFYELQLYELMIDEKEFISILDDLSSFNEMENILLIAILRLVGRQIYKLDLSS